MPLRALPKIQLRVIVGEPPYQTPCHAEPEIRQRSIVQPSQPITTQRWWQLRTSLSARLRRDGLSTPALSAQVTPTLHRPATSVRVMRTSEPSVTLTPHQKGPSTAQSSITTRDLWHSTRGAGQTL